MGKSKSEIEVPPLRPYQFRREWEAEELRSRIEELIGRDAVRSADIDRDELCVEVTDLERILEMVDARDSLAYLEAKRGKKLRKDQKRKR